MNKNTERKTRRYLFSALSLGLAMLLAPQASSATIIEYAIYGDINRAPIQSGPVNLGAIFNTHFNMTIRKGDLILAYDDRGTASTADDRATLKGTTRGCISGGSGGCGRSMNNRASQPFGIHYGSGSFEWDVTMTQTVDALTTGSDNFAFNMQANAGRLTLLSTTSAYQNQLGGKGNPTARLSLKNDRNFAFQIRPDGNGGLTGVGWLALQGGFLGSGGVRFEFGPNNNALNWAFKVEQITPTTPTPPTEIPEPSSVLLLGAALIGAARRKTLAA